MKEKVLILGYKGILGGQLMKLFGNSAVGWDREDCDVTDSGQFAAKLEASSYKLTAIINCVAYNDVDGAEENQQTAFLLNAEVPKMLSGVCKQLDIPLVHFSTNYVFDGVVGEYQEADLPNPASVYAKSKRQGELAVINGSSKFYLIRTAVIFGPKGQSELSKRSFVELMTDLGNKQNRIKAVADEVNSLTYAPDLAAAIKKLLDDKMPYGVYHITNSGFASWYDFAAEIFRIQGKKIDLIPVSASEFPRKAIRPKKAVLINSLLSPLRPWQSALAEFLPPNNQNL